MTAASRGGTLTLGAAFQNRAEPLLYIGFSRSAGLCYVGETISRQGILGRWCQHIGAAAGSDTFAQRVRDIAEDGLNNVCDLTILYWTLDVRLFGSSERSCRLGLEYLVQRRMRELTGVELIPALRLIANVQTNPTVSLDFVKAAADFICDDFTQAYMSEPGR